MLKILWKMGEIAPDEQFLLLSTIFSYLMVEFYVKPRTRISLRDKRLFEITEVEITRVDSSLYSNNNTEPRDVRDVNINYSPLQTGPEVIKLFSCSTQLSMKFFPLTNVKMPTVVGILTFMSGKNSILGLCEPKKSRIS